MIPSLIALTLALLGTPAAAQEERGDRYTSQDIQKLHDLVKQARAQVRELQALVGRREGREGREGRGEHGGRREGREGRGEHGGRREGREGRGEHGGRREGREGRGEHGGRREGREGRGEHGGRREGRGEHGGRREGRESRGEHGEGGEGEEGGKRVKKNEKWDHTRNGTRLVLKYDPESQSFKGVVYNTTRKTLSEVRVEVHLSNGTELGPTKRTDLKPGQKMAVELSAAGQKFEWWTTHPEHGSEEGHGPGHEGEGGEGAGEHGGREGRGDRRPRSGALRPLYNELLLLRREIRMLSNRVRRGQ